MHFVEQKYKLQQKSNETENGKSNTQFFRGEPCP